MGMVQIALAVLTIIIGGICTLLLVSTKTLRDSRDDQEKRILFLEKKSERDDETIEQQAEELRVWQRAVTGEVQLTAILELLNEHHTEATTSWDAIGTGIEHQSAAIGELAEQIGKLVLLLQPRGAL